MPAAPISVYGRTKLAGEQVIPALTSRYFILRTSWLYSEFAGNFVKTMLRLGRERDELTRYLGPGSARPPTPSTWPAAFCILLRARVLPTASTTTATRA